MSIGFSAHGVPSLKDGSLYVCQCFSFNGTIQQDCKECNGTGIVSFNAYPLSPSMGGTNAHITLEFYGWLPEGKDWWMGAVDADTVKATFLRHASDYFHIPDPASRIWNLILWAVKHKEGISWA